METQWDRLLTTTETARVLRVRPDTVRQLVRNGELPAVRLGGSAGYRIRRADLDRFIEERTTHAPDGPAAG